MIMRRGVLLFTLLFALSNCFSQVSFSGKIVDETKGYGSGWSLSSELGLELCNERRRPILIAFRLRLRAVGVQDLPRIDASGPRW